MADEGCCMTQKSLSEFALLITTFQASGAIQTTVVKNDSYIHELQMDENYMKTFDNYADRKFLEDVTKGYKYKIYTNIQSYIYSCRPSSFFKFLLQCPSDLGLCKLRMFAHWLRGRFKYAH